MGQITKQTFVNVLPPMEILTDVGSRREVARPEPVGPTLADQYIYQRGQIYTLLEAKADGTILANMANPAPGIMMHAILRIRRQPGECVRSSRFPPDRNLLLYS
jgi:hypothetical protein